MGHPEPLSMDAAFAGNAVVGGVFGALVAVDALERPEGLAGFELVGALAAFGFFARQDGKAESANLAVNKSDECHGETIPKRRAIHHRDTEAQRTPGNSLR